MKNNVLIILLLASVNSFSQSIKGIVLDAKNQEPIESAAVYFDNTTIGTSTNDKGEFEIEYHQDIQSPLIISFLGYEKLTIPNYDPNTFYRVLIEERNDVLNEVVIIADEGMTRAQKLKYFKSQFLGKSKNAKSCQILNEDDLILRFNKNTKQLIASSKAPLVIENKNLKYKIRYDIKDFVLGFGYVNIETNSFVVESLYYSGTSFYESLNDDKSIARKRNRVYKGSVLHFMRSLAKQKLEEEDYLIIRKRYKVDPEKYISVKPFKTSDSVEVKLQLPLTVLYKNKHQSDLLNNEILLRMRQTHNSSVVPAKSQDANPIKDENLRTSDTASTPDFNTTIFIDGFGNYSPIEALNFIGYMSELRVGDTLPLNYELQEDDN